MPCMSGQWLRENSTQWYRKLVCQRTICRAKEKNIFLEAAVARTVVFATKCHYLYSAFMHICIHAAEVSKKNIKAATVNRLQYKKKSRLVFLYVFKCTERFGIYSLTETVIM